MVFVGAAATGSCHAVERLENAHAHNDYWHERPLFDALDQGFTSVEADIFLRDGKLLIGHEFKELNPEKTLESLYLEPLARRVRDHGLVHVPIAEPLGQRGAEHRPSGAHVVRDRHDPHRPSLSLRAGDDLPAGASRPAGVGAPPVAPLAGAGPNARRHQYLAAPR